MNNKTKENLEMDKHDMANNALDICVAMGVSRCFVKFYDVYKRVRSRHEKES